MALAFGVTRALGFDGTLTDLQASEIAKTLRILEVNEAGGLTPILRQFPGHQLVEYPAADLMNLDIEDESIDLLIHSDTLEHVPRPIRALAECLRVLKPTGRLVFTVPVIYGRLTTSREGLVNSYHDPRAQRVDMRVATEYGADVWAHVLSAGFSECRMIALEYPSGLAITATR